MAPFHPYGEDIYTIEGYKMKVIYVLLIRKGDKIRSKFKLNREDRSLVLQRPCGGFRGVYILRKKERKEVLVAVLKSY